VGEDGGRSTAKLECGHQFHLDCIGSAFNMKGAMQCPNCRRIEKGRWLYATGSACSFPDIALDDDWSTPHEDSYELSYSEIPFGVHWCPFSGLTRFHSSFEELESPSTTYPDLQGNHSIFSEHTAGSPLHPHSYVAYLQPIPPNSGENIDDPNFSHQWNNGLFGHNEIYTPFPANTIQFQGWGRHHPPNRTHNHNNIHARLRPGRPDSEALSRPFHPSHGSVTRGGIPFVSATVHPSNSPRSHHISHATHRHQQPGMPLSILPGVRRFIAPRGPPLPTVTPSDHSRGFFMPTHPREREYPSLFPIVSFERDSAHHSNGGSNSGTRSGSLQQRHWS
jgi:hypothetical protein